MSVPVASGVLGLRRPVGRLSLWGGLWTTTLNGGDGGGGTDFEEGVVRVSALTGRAGLKNGCDKILCSGMRCAGS